MEFSRSSSSTFLEVILVLLSKLRVFPVILYRYESWTIKKAERWRIDAFGLWCWRRLLRVPWTARSNQSIIGRIDAEAEALILWLPDAKRWLLRKDPDDGKDWRQEEKGRTEEEMVGCHHQLNGHEFEQALGDSEGQKSLAWCNPQGESDTTEEG